MRTDPDLNRILIDYVALTERFGELDFDTFLALWHAADALTDDLLALDPQPENLPSFIPPGD